MLHPPLFRVQCGLPRLDRIFTSNRQRLPVDARCRRHLRRRWTVNAGNASNRHRPRDIEAEPAYAPPARRSIAAMQPCQRLLPPVRRVLHGAVAGAHRRAAATRKQHHWRSRRCRLAPSAGDHQNSRSYCFRMPCTCVHPVALSDERTCRRRIPGHCARHADSSCSPLNWPSLWRMSLKPRDCGMTPITGSREDIGRRRWAVRRSRYRSVADRGRLALVVTRSAGTRCWAGWRLAIWRCRGCGPSWR